MLKKLQRRFVKITLLSLIAIVILQLFAVNFVNVVQKDANCKNFLSIISKSGQFPAEYSSNDIDFFEFINPFRVDTFPKQTPYSTSYFIVSIKNNSVFDIMIQDPDIDEKIAFEMASTAFQKGYGYGFVGMYRSLFVKPNENGISKICFVNYEKDMTDSLKIAGITLIVGLFLVVLFIFPIIIFSKRSVKPIEQSIEKQKQFITDASHELKTPIAIISANAEVLEMVQGKTEWTDSIKNQSARLSTLVKNLVSLSKLQETKNKPKIRQFNLSDAVFDVAKAFETPAEAKGVEIIFDVQDNVYLNASESELRELTSILCDNAVKYVTENGIIKVTCKKRNRNVILQFYNDCENIDPEKLSRLFDRFYRTDNSRNSSTGGYGIGLSIAQAIVERNNGKISATSTKPNSITFSIQF